jgi:heat shock protein HspQ
MQSKIDYQPSFSGLQNMQQAVERVVRRKKAMGQYIVVAENGQIKKIDFSIIKK